MLGFPDLGDPYLLRGMRHLSQPIDLPLFFDPFWHVPRSRYWNADTVAAVGARFEGRMDMTPYWESLPLEARL